MLASVTEVREALAAAGLDVIRGDLARAQAKGEAVRLQRHGRTDEPIVVDLLFATTPFEIAALARRHSLRVLGVELPVAIPEDLFVFKLIAGRRRIWLMPIGSSPCTVRPSIWPECGSGVAISVSRIASSRSPRRSERAAPEHGATPGRLLGCAAGDRDARIHVH
jgi:hypothetical protein